MDINREALEEWQKNQPLCILSLDPADRAVLRVAGRNLKAKNQSYTHSMAYKIHVIRDNL